LSEKESSLNYSWNDREVSKIIQNWNSGAFEIITAHPSRLTRQSTEVDSVLNDIHEVGARWKSHSVGGIEALDWRFSLADTQIGAVKDHLNQRKFVTVHC